MFSDGKIQENFSWGKTKYSYVVCFGLDPSFKGFLTKSLHNVEHVLALFDESFNKTSNCGQMHMHVQYWDNNHSYVATCYYHSEFMSKTSEKDVFGPFSSCLSSCSRFLLMAQI